PFRSAPACVELCLRAPRITKDIELRLRPYSRHSEDTVAGAYAVCLGAIHESHRVVPTRYYRAGQLQVCQTSDRRIRSPCDRAILITVRRAKKVISTGAG